MIFFALLPPFFNKVSLLLMNVVKPTCLLCLLWGSFFACSPTQENNAVIPGNSEKKTGEIVEYYEKLTWKDLDSLKIDYYFDEDYGDYLGKPTFSQKIKAWEGKKVSIEGYWIPVSEIGDSSVVVLSALPFAQCFFCSGAGIETVMQIKPKEKWQRLDTDAQVILKGSFHLNKNNPMELYYQLLEASLQ